MKKIIASIFFIIITSNSHAGVRFAAYSTIENQCQPEIVLGIMQTPHNAPAPILTHESISTYDMLTPNGVLATIKWTAAGNRYKGKTAHIDLAVNGSTSQYDACFLRNCNISGKGSGDPKTTVTANLECEDVNADPPTPYVFPLFGRVLR